MSKMIALANEGLIDTQLWSFYSFSFSCFYRNPHRLTLLFVKIHPPEVKMRLRCVR